MESAIVHTRYGTLYADCVLNLGKLVEAMQAEYGDKWHQFTQVQDKRMKLVFSIDHKQLEAKKVHGVSTPKLLRMHCEPRVGDKIDIV